MSIVCVSTIVCGEEVGVQILSKPIYLYAVTIIQSLIQLYLQNIRWSSASAEQQI